MTIPSLLMVLAPLSRNTYHIHEDLLLGCLSHCWSCCFDYCNDIMNFEIRDYETSNFAASFQDCLGHLEYLRFHGSFCNAVAVL